MLKYLFKKIKCPECGREVEVKFKVVLNTSSDYKLKNILLKNEFTLDNKSKRKSLSRKLTSFRCDCGNFIYSDYPFLYQRIKSNNSIVLKYIPKPDSNCDNELNEAVIKESRNNFDSNFKKPFYLMEKRGRSLIKKFISKNQKETDILEIYNDWDDFIKRILEIG